MLRSARRTNADDHKRAQELRRNASPSERALWKQLSQAAAIAGLRFRRQQPIPPYFADFACMQARLLIELDGFSHETRAEYDERRDAYLREQGYTVVHFGNETVHENPKGVVATILAKALKLLAPGPPASKN